MDLRQRQKSLSVVAEQAGGNQTGAAAAPGMEHGPSFTDRIVNLGASLGAATKSMRVLKNVSSMEYEGLLDWKSVEIKRHTPPQRELEGEQSGDGPGAPDLQRDSTSSTASRGFRRAISAKAAEYRPHRWKVAGVRRRLLEDFAFVTLDMSMPQLLAFVVSVYLGFTLVFAAAFYCLGLDHLAGYDPDEGLAPLEAVFWYSAVNLVTTGYGTWVPTSRAGYAVATTEQFCGLLLSALLLSVIVTKASMTRAMLIFSEVATVSQCNGVVVLTCRVGNARGNFLYSPDIRMSYVRPIRSSEGTLFWEEERLSTADAVSLKPVYYINHAITPDSPLYGKTEEDLHQERGFVAIVVSATDDRTFQTLYARTVYRTTTLRWNHRLEEVLVERTVGEGVSAVRELTVDFTRFHLTAPLDPAHCILNTAGSSAPDSDGMGSGSEAGSALEETLAMLVSRLESLREEVAAVREASSSSTAPTGLQPTGGACGPPRTAGWVKAMGLGPARHSSLIPPTMGGEPAWQGRHLMGRLASVKSFTPIGPGDPIPFAVPARASPTSQQFLTSVGPSSTRSGVDVTSPFQAVSQVPFSPKGGGRTLKPRVSFGTNRNCSPVREHSREGVNSESLVSRSASLHKVDSGSHSLRQGSISWEAPSSDDIKMPVSPFEQYS